MRSIVFVLLWCMVFVIPWEVWGSVPRLGTLVRLVGYVAVVAAFISVATRLSVRRLPLAFLALILFVGWNFMSAFWAVNPQVAMRTCVTYAMLLLFAWMIWEFCPSYEQQLGLMRAYILGSVVSLVALYWSYFFGEISFQAKYVRYTGGGLNPNNLSLLLALSVPIAVYLASRSSPRLKFLRWAYWAFIPADVTGVFLTGSRGGVTAMTVGIILTLVVAPLGKWRFKLMFIVCVVAASVLIPKLVSSCLLERVGEGIHSHSFANRLEIWQKGFECWLEHPAIGVGAQGYSWAATGTLQRPGQVAHNTFLQVLVDLGVVGLALYALCAALLLRCIWLMPRTECFLWLTVFAVWATGAMASSIGYHKYTWLVFALIFSQSSALCNGVPMHRQPLLYWRYVRDRRAPPEDT